MGSPALSVQEVSPHFFCSKLLHKLGQVFLDIQHVTLPSTYRSTRLAGLPWVTGPTRKALPSVPARAARTKHTTNICFYVKRRFVNLYCATKFGLVLHVFFFNGCGYDPKFPGKTNLDRHDLWNFRTFPSQ